MENLKSNLNRREGGKEGRGEETARLELSNEVTSLTE